MDTEEEEQTQGSSFTLIRSVLGSIAGGLSSLASLPFGKRKKPESPLPAEPCPSSSTGVDLDADNLNKLYPDIGVDLNTDNLNKLYPDIELSETRKRARLSWDDVVEDMVGFNNSKAEQLLDRKDLEENLEVVLGDIPPRFDRTSNLLDDVQYTADDMSHNALANDGGLSDGVHGEFQAQLIPNVSTAVSGRGHDETLFDEGKNLDEDLARFRTARKKASTTKKRKQEDDLSNEDSPRKKVRFGESALANSQAIGSMPEQKGDMRLHTGITRAKRKQVDLAEDNSEKRPRDLNSSGVSVVPEGRTSTIDMSSILTKKRRRANDDHLVTQTTAEDLKPRKDKRSKTIGDTDKPINSHSAFSLSKDEHATRPAIPHKMGEVGVAKELASAPVDETWRVFVSNTPTDVKDEELFDLFTASGSLKLDVATVKVVRDPRSGLSKGTAYVFFKTEADVDRLMSSKRSFKLRGRVLRVSRRAMAPEQKPKQSQAAKRPANPETKDSNSPQKRVKPSLVNEGEKAANECVQEVAQILTRNRRSSGESVKKQFDVVVVSSHAMVSEQKSQKLPAKPSKSPKTKDKKSPQKRVKLSSSHGGERAEKQCLQNVVQILTRSKSSNESGKELLDVVVASAHVSVKKKAATALSPHKHLVESPEAKRKRNEKHQRGISRSKKIRRA